MKELFWKFVNRKFKDEPLERPDRISRKTYPFEIYPQSDRYRIIEYPLNSIHKYSLQAFYNGDWIDVQTYDNGYDDYGKLHSAKWKPLYKDCNWSLNGLKKLMNELLGKPEEIKICVEE